MELNIQKRLNGTNPSSNEEILKIDNPYILNFKSEVVIVNSQFSRIKKRFNTDNGVIPIHDLGFKKFGFSP